MAKAKTTTRQRSTSDPVLAYAQDVLAGRIIAGPHVRNECRRHLLDREKGHERGLTWDLPAAMRAINFCRDVLRLNGGQFEGIPFVLQPAQAFQLGSLFGWKRADGTRRFRRFYNEESKGNGKSPKAAAIGLYCMLADNEPRAEIYAAAAKKDQAFVLFRDAVAMVEQSPALSKRIVKSGLNPVWNLSFDGSFFRPISSEGRQAGGKSGPRPHCALCDEVHEHPNSSVVDMLERGFKWRTQPLLVMTTNSGTDKQSSCWQEHLHAVRVAAGTMTPDEDFTFVGEVIDDETFTYVCALDKGEDPLKDPSCWIKSNPLLGVTVKEDYLAAVVHQANTMPGKANAIRRLHFCEWTDAEKLWISRPTLESVLADFDPEEHRGKRAILSLDLSGTQDLTALTAIVDTGHVEVEGNDGPVMAPTFDLWGHYFTPADTIMARSDRDRAPYNVWADQGHLEATPGPVVRFDFVAARVAELCALLDVEMIVYDRYAYRRFEEELANVGVTVQQVEHPQGGVRRGKAPQDLIDEAKRSGQEAPQGLWMPGSVLAFEQMILERRVRLRHSPVLISACMSAAQEHDAFNNRWFSKRRAVNRIDALVSATMAAGGATAEFRSNAGGSVYERRGLLII